MIESRYPAWDVMGARDEWDEHTRTVIRKRLEPPQPPAFFTEDEATVLKAAAARLLADDDPWRIGKVLEHIDGIIAHGTGEGYRKEGQPPEPEFWREIAHALGPDFAALPPTAQDQRFTQLPKDFFKALLKETVTAYCALPPVWSFMGYGGPAFPRGYVRIELGLRDPWEAKPGES